METTDGTHWVITRASYLAGLPVWRGNRVFDQTHANKIYASVAGDVSQLSMNPYRIVDVKQDDNSTARYIIDGQHRVSLLKKHFDSIGAEDFTVMVAINKVDNEDDVIAMFRKVNMTKSIEWREDPVLLANRLIEALMKAVNTDKKRPLIRSAATRKPYLSADKLREALLLSKKMLDASPHDFVAKALQANDALLGSLDPKKPSEHDAVILRFALGLDEKFTWLR